VRDYTRGVVRELAAMGCDYIQLDAPIYADIADPEYRRSMADLGSAYGENLAFDAELDNSVFEGLNNITTAIHLCRGNNAGRWLASGSYDAIASQLFPKLKMDRLLLEFDSPRAGGFEPLKFVNKDTVAVLGLITTKSGKLEDRDSLQARIREASKYHDFERLAVSPQCGFASSLEGNPLTMAEQEAKLRLVVNVAQKAWGST
jgi:methionine synthase II (cobalamin-independent)